MCHFALAHRSNRVPFLPRTICEAGKEREREGSWERSLRQPTLSSHPRAKDPSNHQAHLPALRRDFRFSLSVSIHFEADLALVTFCGPSCIERGFCSIPLLLGSGKNQLGRDCFGNLFDFPNEEKWYWLGKCFMKLSMLKIGQVSKFGTSLHKIWH